MSLIQDYEQHYRNIKTSLAAVEQATWATDLEVGMMGDQPVIVLKDYAKIPLLRWIIGQFRALFCDSPRQEIRAFLERTDRSYSTFASLAIHTPIENKKLKHLMKYSAKANLLQEKLTFKASGTDVHYYRTFRSPVDSFAARVHARFRESPEQSQALMGRLREVSPGNPVVMSYLSAIAEASKARAAVEELLKDASSDARKTGLQQLMDEVKEVLNLDKAVTMPLLKKIDDVVKVEGFQTHFSKEATYLQGAQPLLGILWVLENPDRYPEEQYMSVLETNRRLKFLTPDKLKISPLLLKCRLKEIQKNGTPAERLELIQSIVTGSDGEMKKALSHYIKGQSVEDQRQFLEGRCEGILLLLSHEWNPFQSVETLKKLLARLDSEVARSPAECQEIMNRLAALCPAPPANLLTEEGLKELQKATDFLPFSVCFNAYPQLKRECSGQCLVFQEFTLAAEKIPQKIELINRLLECLNVSDFEARIEELVTQDIPSKVNPAVLLEVFLGQPILINALRAILKKPEHQKLKHCFLQSAKLVAGPSVSVWRFIANVTTPSDLEPLKFLLNIILQPHQSPRLRAGLQEFINKEATEGQKALFYDSVLTLQHFDLQLIQDFDLASLLEYAAEHHPAKAFVLLKAHLSLSVESLSRLTKWALNNSGNPLSHSLVQKLLETVMEGNQQVDYVEAMISMPGFAAKFPAACQELKSKQAALALSLHTE